MKLRLKIFLFILVLLWNLGIYPGILYSINSNSIIAFQYMHKIYSGVCHQQGAKLFELLGINTMVCSRCAGIYLGVLISSILFLFMSVNINSGIKYLLISSIPLILDVILYHTGLYEYSKPVAFSTGLVFGSAGFYYFYIGLEKLFFEYKTEEKI